MLEAGPQLDPAKDFSNHARPYEMKYRGFDRPGERERTYPNQWTANEYSKHLYVKDAEHPYTTPEGKPFRWVRSRFVGGKLLHWGRNARRMNDFHFRAADRDGYGENWPIRYADMAPYYDKVESFVGVAASIEKHSSCAGREIPAADAPQLRREDHPENCTKGGNASDSQAGGDAYPEYSWLRKMPLLRHVRERVRRGRLLEFSL